MTKMHLWIRKGRWHRYGDYIYRDDKCNCGCVRRIVIDTEGKEVVESYTKEENTSVAWIPCTRPRGRKKIKLKKSKKKIVAPDEERSVATVLQ